MAFREMLVYLDQIGVADVLLPFILIFTVVFAVLQKSNILGIKDKRNTRFNGMVSLVIGLAVVIPHVLDKYPPGADVVVIMNKALPNVGLVLIAILALLLIIGIFGHNIDIAGSSLGGWIVIAAIVGVIYIFVSAAGWVGTPSWLSFIHNPETQVLVVVILVFAVIVWFITRDTSEEKESKGVAENFRKLLRGSRED